MIDESGDLTVWAFIVLFAIIVTVGLVVGFNLEGWRDSWRRRREPKLFHDELMADRLGPPDPDAESIGPGDPGYEMMRHIMETGEGAYGTVDDDGHWHVTYFSMDGDDESRTFGQE